MSGAAAGRIGRLLPAGSDGRNAALLGVASLLGPLGGFAANIAYARTLGPSGRGDLAAVVAALAVCEAVLVLGFPDILTRHVASRLVPSGGLRKAMLCGLAISGPMSLAVVWLAAVRGFDLVALLAVAVVIPLATVAALGRGVLAGRRAFKRLAVSLTFGGVIRIVSPLVLFAVGSEKGDLALLLIALSTAAAAVPVLAAKPFADPGDAAPLRFRAMATQALGIWPASMAWSLNARLDQLVLVALVSPAALGKYAVCVTVAELPIVLASGLRQVVLVRASEVGGAGRVVRMTFAILTLGVGAAAVALATGEAVMTWVFGQAFAGTAGILAALLLASSLTISAGLLNSCLIALGHGRWTFVSQSTGLVLSAVLLVAIIPDAGGIEAASLIKVGAAASVYLVAVRLICRSENASSSREIKT